MMKSPVKLQKPPGYVLASIVCSFGGFLFGIDTGIIGPVTVMDDFERYVGRPSPTVHGLIVSSILIPAALSSCLAGRLADAQGRPRAIALGALVFGLGAALEAAAAHVAMFVLGRVVEGLGEGLYLGTLVVYICEIAPPRARGPLTTAPQLLTTLGLVTGFFTCYGTGDLAGSLSWRLPFALLAAYAALFAAAALLWLPPSPRWLMLRGRRDEAARAWEALGVPAADREKIIVQVQEAVVEHAAAPVDAAGSMAMATAPAPRDGEATPRAGLPQAGRAPRFAVFAPDARPRLFFAVFLMSMQQLSGIDGVLYYAPLLFRQAGLSSQSAAFLASGVSALVIFAVTIPATLLADRWGRRANTVLGGLGMAATMFLMGGLYAGGAVHADRGAGRWVVIVAIYVFAVVYCVSWAVGIKLYAAEIQPARTRATATSIAHGGNWLANFLVALVTPPLLARSAYGAYFLFGGCALATALVCCVAMPETRGRSLDDIDAAFSAKRLARRHRRSGGPRPTAGRLGEILERLLARVRSN